MKVFCSLEGLLGTRLTSSAEDCSHDRRAFSEGSGLRCLSPPSCYKSVLQKSLDNGSQRPISSLWRVVMRTCGETFTGASGCEVHGVIRMGISAMTCFFPLRRFLL
jgi:hypothetical protein